MNVNSYLSTNPIPSTLPSKLPDPQSPWEMSAALFKRTQQAPYDSTMRYRSCEVIRSDPEFDFVVQYLLANKPPGLAITKITAIHNSSHTDAFIGSLKDQDTEISKFPPSWKTENLKHQRSQVNERYERQKDLFQPLQIKGQRAVSSLSNQLGVLPLFHGSKQWDSIASSGFIYFGKHGGASTASTDIGFFGSGIYFSNSARYASMYSTGTVILAMVSMRPPYPVVSDAKTYTYPPSDMQKLAGMGGFKDYNSHFIPVSSVQPTNPHCMNYFPTIAGDTPAWDEFVIFSPYHALPRFIIELGSELVKAPSVAYTFTNFINACKYGEKDKISGWIKEDPERLKERDAEGKTLLHMAVEFRKPHIVSLLLQHDSLLNLTDKRGKNAFHYAAEVGDVEIGKMLLKNKPSFFEIATDRKLFPTHLAALNGHLPFLQWLHAASMLIKNKGAEGWSTLHCAACGGHTACVNWIYDQLKDFPVSSNGSSALHVAAEFGRNEVIEELLKKDNAFFKSNQWKDKPNDDGFTPLLTAARFNQKQAFALLLASGASITHKDNDGYLPIHWIAKAGSMEMLQIALISKTPIDPKGLYDRTPLHMAAFCGHALIIAMLIQKGANVNAQTSKEDLLKTPLHDAVMHDHLASVQELLKAPSINVNLRDISGHTPLWHAVISGFVHLIPEILLHKSYVRLPVADPDSIDNLCNKKSIQNKEEVIKALKENS